MHHCYALRRNFSNGVNMSYLLLQRYLTGVVLVSVLLPVAHADNADPTEKLSKKLVEMRGIVNDLSNELILLRDEHKQEMRSLLNQKANVEAEINQEKLSLESLREKLQKNRALIETTGADKASVRDELLKHIAFLKEYIQAGMPFKQSDRLAVVQEFESRLSSGVLSPHKAANQFWSMIEDELKLTRENGIYRQPLMIDGEEHLVDVAKLGMVMMFYRLDEDRFGFVNQEQDKWIAHNTDSSTHTAQIKTLFGSLEKQVRSGYFELPGVY